MTQPTNPARLTPIFPNIHFCSLYTEELGREHARKPDQYAWPVEDLPIVVTKMVAAIIKGSGNINSPALKRTCKRLKIKPSLRSIQAYLSGEAP